MWASKLVVHVMYIWDWPTRDTEHAQVNVFIESGLSKDKFKLFFMTI